MADKDVPQLIAIAVLNCIVNIIALAVNIPVFLGIIKAHLQTGMKIFLASMTLTDLFIAIVLQPIVLTKLIRKILGYPPDMLELISGVLWFALLPISLFSLTLVSLERYILIYYPLRSDWKSLPQLAIGLSILNWIFAPTLGLSAGISFIKEIKIMETLETVSNAVMLAVVLGLIAIHLRIFITARKVLSDRGPLGKHAYICIAEIKQAAITTGMFLTILVSYPPYLIFRLVDIHIAMDVEEELHKITSYWLLLFITMSFVLKQFLLGILNRDVRSTILRQWRIFHRRKLIWQESAC